jgi:hypothetical protein
MCLKCGAPSGPHWSERLLADTAPPGWRRREQASRAALLDGLVRRHGLRVRPSPGTAGYVVADSKGSSRAAERVDDLWPALDAFSPRCADPLDPSLLDRLVAGDDG